jgi:hypothetical protein
MSTETSTKEEPKAPPTAYKDRFVAHLEAYTSSFVAAPSKINDSKLGAEKGAVTKGKENGYKQSK